MFPVATACGNTSIIKPSEKDPGATMMLVELARQAGFPDGVINVVHGWLLIIRCYQTDLFIK